jgi:hypothetical protein
VAQFVFAFVPVGGLVVVVVAVVEVEVVDGRVKTKVIVCCCVRLC